MAARKHSEDKSSSLELSLAELAERTGIPERTIRYYIARGILAGPSGGGRGAFYTGEHLQRLQVVQRMQRQGLTLAEIERDANADSSPRLVEPEAWWAYTVAPDVVVQVRSGLSPWRARRVKAAVAKLAAELGLADSGPRKEES